MTERDGFVIREIATGEEAGFIACDKDDRPREKVEMGLLRRVDTDRHFVADTRDEEPA